MTPREFRAAFFFCGLGAGALGFIRSLAKLGSDEARFVSVGAFDNDPLACQDFEYLTGAKATVADMSTITPAEIRAVIGETAPDCIFMSSPCKGLSSLLSAKQANSEKYQAMNRLVLTGIFLACETWKKPPGLLVLENVPRIRTRGKHLLIQAKALLSQYGYVFHEQTHELGEVGGLGQIRRRYLLVARQPEVVPAYVYRPPRQRVKACGEVLAELPIPGDPAAGAMHELPRISWLNWLRLALIPAGGDWRDLPGPAAAAPGRFSGALGVMPFDEPSRTVAGESYPSNGSASVADPRVPTNSFGNVDRVTPWEDPVGTITASPAPSSGGAAVADPRVPLASGPGAHTNIMSVNAYDEPTRTVTGATRPGAGALSVADPRLPVVAVVPYDQGRPGAFGVNAWDAPAPSVTGSMRPSGSNTPAAVADPRVAELANAVAMKTGKGWSEDKPGLMGVNDWEKPTRAVVGRASISGSNGVAAVADPRAVALSDSPSRHRNKYHVDGWDDPAQTVTGATRPGSGAGATADPRRPWSGGGASMGVIDWRKPAPTVRGAERVSQGQVAIADPRLTCEPRAGTYGVLDWRQAAHAITGNARIDNGSFAIADPRFPVITDPKKEKPDFVPVIIAEDGTWHRPLTTLELAVLQALPPMVNGKPLQLAGRAVGKWRERIGNAVPVHAATAIAETLLKALLAAALGTWTLGSTGIWVSDDGVTEDDAEELSAEGAAA